MPHPSEDDLTLLALGEQISGAPEHLRTCAPCRTEVQALAGTVRAAREADLAVLPPPPPAVWERVRSELGLSLPAAVPAPRVGAGAGAADREDQGAGSPFGGRRRLALAAAALSTCAVIAAVTAGVLALRPLDDPGTTLALQALEGSPGRGAVTVTTGADGSSLALNTQDLPPVDGFYEVWLLDPSSLRLVALGTLDGRGAADLGLPPGVDLADYPNVDVSAEPDDGDPRHSGASVLRADLPR